MVRLRSIVMRTCAIALVLWGFSLAAPFSRGQSADSVGTAPRQPSVYRPVRTVWATDAGDEYSSPVPAAVDLGAWNGMVPAANQPELNQPIPVGDAWISAPNERHPIFEPGDYFADPAWDGSQFRGAGPSTAWHWQVLPDGLIYRSYQAGVREARLSILAFHEDDGQSFWDGTLGGRVGMLRYGTCGPVYPQGWQLDLEAAAIVRLTLDEIRDFETADYRVGVPLTYGVENWQFKFAVYHLSSHLGDEFAIANPGSLDERINYVRDALVVGASYYPHPAWRLYSEAAYAVNVDGGAEPWEFQFGTELSEPGPTGLHGTPFLAANAHLREEHEFGGDVTFQAGWLWRGRSGQVSRMGLHLYNGKSSQYQIFNNSEQQIGFGLWYDY
ncbi:MAG TPA: DUF1207 domain-containing protein [Lacipirellulaceae bacterium]|jgi:hypothetical protein|nr:DUF1207 domain-containing protein [Lacipirellulaceae bacterium]